MKKQSKRVEILEGRIKTLESTPDSDPSDIDPEELKKRESFIRFIQKHRGRTFEHHQQFMEAVLEEVVFDPTDPGKRPDSDNEGGPDPRERQEAFRRFTDPANWPRTVPALKQDSEKGE